MSITYATYAQFTEVYSLRGLSQADINSGYLPKGALRVNEFLGNGFSLPFSSNNQTARELNISYSYLEYLKANTLKQDDGDELEAWLDKRITMINCGQTPMITDSGDRLFPDQVSTLSKAYMPYMTRNNTFNVGSTLNQHVSCDLLEDIRNDDDC